MNGRLSAYYPLTRYMCFAWGGGVVTSAGPGSSASVDSVELDSGVGAVISIIFIGFQSFKRVQCFARVHE